MSTLKVEVVQIDAILPHPNADRLEIAQVKGWQCVTGKGNFVAGDLAVYFPIDSILPEPLEVKLFDGAKVKLSKHRIRTIKLRGAVSQGMLVRPGELGLSNVRLGDDLTEHLGVTKYEPPETSTPQSRGFQASKKQVHPDFRKYTDIENYKNHPKLFEPDELVWVLEKIHGSNFRAGWVPYYPRKWWQKVWHWLGMSPEWEFVYGSHNVQLQDRPKDTPTWHGGNIYLEMVEKYDLKNRIPKGYVVYGEVYGDGVQKGYLYDCKPGERKLAMFDVTMAQDNGGGLHYIYLPQLLMETLCRDWGLPIVPVLALPVPFADVGQFVDGPSWLTRDQKVREGIVIKPKAETSCYIGRKILKWKSDDFLMKAEDNTH